MRAESAKGVWRANVRCAGARAGTAGSHAGQRARSTPCFRNESSRRAHSAGYCCCSFRPSPRSGATVASVRQSGQSGAGGSAESSPERAACWSQHAEQNRCSHDVLTGRNSRARQTAHSSFGSCEEEWLLETSSSSATNRMTAARPAQEHSVSAQESEERSARNGDAS